MKNILKEVHNIKPKLYSLRYEGVSDEISIIIKPDIVRNLFLYFERELKKDLEEGTVSYDNILRTIKLDYNVLLLLSQMGFVVNNSQPQNPYSIEEKRLLDKEIFKYFKNVFSPVNFFKFINDLSIYSYNEYHLEPIRFILSDVKKLQQINEFYNNYSDICKENEDKGYSPLYLFQILSLETDEIGKNIIDNILEYLTCDDIKKRKLACNIIIEYENIIRFLHISMEDKKEYHNKINIIDKNLEYIFKTNALKYSTYYSIDALYSLVRA